MDKKTKEKRETPIIDGDARPDMPVGGGNAKDRNKNQKPEKDGEKKFESERTGDINSLEDFKDAK